MSRPTISTTGGDNGKTSLYSGTRVSKSSERIQAYGDVDELNSVLGMVLVEKDLPEEISDQLCRIQKMLFTLGADLATPIDAPQQISRMKTEHIETLELWGHQLENNLPELHHFILPGGSVAGSLLHAARTVCRRTERWTVALSEREEVNPHALVYINRLSDYFFLAARTVNRSLGAEEREWHSDE